MDPDDQRDIEQADDVIHRADNPTSCTTCGERIKGRIYFGERGVLCGLCKDDEDNA